MTLFSRLVLCHHSTNSNKGLESCASERRSCLYFYHLQIGGLLKILEDSNRCFPNVLSMFGLIIGLTLLSGLADAQGFIHASTAWVNGKLIWEEGIKSLLGFAVEEPSVISSSQIF